MNVRIMHGDCLELLATLDAESVHACVTDPPYGIGFMGKQWDTFKPSNVLTAADTKQRKNPEQIADMENVYGRKRSPAKSPSSVSYDESLTGHRAFQQWCEAWAREVYRVLKPGAHLLCSGAPRSHHRMISGIEDAGFEIRDCVLWLFGQGFPKSHNLEGDWEGWGTALKPAWEPVILARKPFKGSVAKNVEANGCGALNVDGCRIDGAKASGSYAPPMKFGGQNARPFHEQEDKREFEAKEGRWPANVIHDGSAPIVEGFPAEAGAAAPVRRRNGDKFRATYGAFKGDVDEQGSTFQGDSGSAARFYYCPKADQADRNEGGVTNTHPTVKPTDLMRYLCRLVTPPGGTVLDPFMGSGSTGKAAELEGFGFIGIEREAAYVEIAKRRIAGDIPLFSRSAA